MPQVVLLGAAPLLEIDKAVCPSFRKLQASNHEVSQVQSEIREPYLEVHG